MSECESILKKCVIYTLNNKKSNMVISKLIKVKKKMILLPKILIFNGLKYYYQQS